MRRFHVLLPALFLAACARSTEPTVPPTTVTSPPMARSTATAAPTTPPRAIATSTPHPTATPVPTATPSPTPAVAGRLLLASQAGGNLQIYRQEPMAVGSEMLVDSLDVGLDVRYALLSPNGRYLAVHVYGFDPETNSDGIYLVDLDGASAGRLLAAARGFGSIIGGLGWSPDGERLAFSAPPDVQFAAGPFSDQLVMAAAGQPRTLTGGIANDLFIADVTDLSLTRLTDSPRDETQPSWSPDGQRIAFAANDPSNPADGYFHYDLHVIDLETGVQTQLTEPSASAAEPNRRPAWSPDGQRIAFISWRAPDGPDLYVVPSAGGEPRRVTYFLRHRLDAPLAWSPDGRWIALSTDGDTYLIPTTGGEPIHFPDRSIVGWLPK